MKRMERALAVEGRTDEKIEALYAWVAEEPEGGEGIISVEVHGMTIPLIGADLDRVESFRSTIERIHAEYGYRITLVKLSQREDLEVLPATVTHHQV